MLHANSAAPHSITWDGYAGDHGPKFLEHVAAFVYVLDRSFRLWLHQLRRLRGDDFVLTE